MQISGLLGFFTRDILTAEMGRVRTQGERSIEVLFIKFEGVANILGFITEVSGTSGTIRVVVGVVQIVVFSTTGIFHWIRASCQDEPLLQNRDFAYSDYARGIVFHGFGNVVRGVFESCMQPVGNWLCIIYALSGERMRYNSEAINPNNLFDAVVPSAREVNPQNQTL